MSRNFLREKGRWYLFLSALSLSVVVIFQNCAKGIQTQLSSGGTNGSSVIEVPNIDTKLSMDTAVGSFYLPIAANVYAPLNPYEIRTSYLVRRKVDRENNFPGYQLFLDQSRFYVMDLKTKKFISPQEYCSHYSSTQTCTSNLIVDYWMKEAPAPDNFAPHDGEIQDIRLTFIWPRTNQIHFWTSKKWFVMNGEDGSFYNPKTYDFKNPELNKSVNELAGNPSTQTNIRDSNTLEELLKNTTLPIGFSISNLRSAFLWIEKGGHLDGAFGSDGYVYFMDENYEYMFDTRTLSFKRDNELPEGRYAFSGAWLEAQGPRRMEDRRAVCVYVIDGVMYHQNADRRFAIPVGGEHFLSDSDYEKNYFKDWGYDLYLYGKQSYSRFSLRQNKFIEKQSIEAFDSGGSFAPTSSDDIHGILPWESFLFFISSSGKYFTYSLRDKRFIDLTELKKTYPSQKSLFISDIWGDDIAKGLAPDTLESILIEGSRAILTDKDKNVYGLNLGKSQDGFVITNTLKNKDIFNVSEYLTKIRGASVPNISKRISTSFYFDGGLRILTNDGKYIQLNPSSAESSSMSESSMNSNGLGW